MKLFTQYFAFVFFGALISVQVCADKSINYTYNTAGQVLTEDGPRTDVNDISTYTYDSQGNKATFTNALSQQIKYTSYDSFGRLLSVTDVNGIVTQFTYNNRGWLLTSTVKHPTNNALDSVTSYGYDVIGQMISMTLPNGYQLGYEYDGARRLTAIKNAANERIEYTLDAAGNRTKQIIKNNTGIIVYSATQAFDELSRVMSVTGNHGQNTQHQYDVNDNETAITDGRNNKTQKTFDALNRVAKIIDPNLKETNFTYDTQNRIKTTTDAKGNTTTYNYDGLNNLISQTSPDTGTTTFTYDAAGNRISAKDARNIVVNYTYDALNRLTSVNYPAASNENVTYAYDSTANGSYGISRLSSVTTSAARNDYVYNHLGLITKKFTQIGNTLNTIQYTYDAAGNLSSVIYPSGRIVNYVRDNAGRVQSITTQANATAAIQTVVSNINYLPFGPVSSYAYGNGLSHTNSFDTDYRLTSILVGGVLSRGYNYDPNDNITGISDAISSTKNQTLNYDPLNRLTTAQGIYGSLGYTYDDVGNRLTETASGTTATYNYETASNRLLGITKTGANRSFSYDAAGNRVQGTSDTGTAQTFTFNNANRLASVNTGSNLTATYTYNASGQRVSKLLSGNVQELYHYDESSQLIAVTDGAGVTQREYIYNGTTQVGFVALANQSVPVPPVTLPAGGATLTSGVSLSTSHSGYTGSDGFIQFVGEGQISWPVTISAGTTAGLYSASIRYSLAGINCPLNVFLDGVQISNITFTPTANLDTWATASISLPLTTGSHTITLKTTGNGGPNIDALSLVTSTIVKSPTLYYVHNDHKNTPQVVTAQNKSVVWMADYLPFGKLKPNQTNSLELYSRFPGQYVDQETGLYYNYFRDYDASIGRYIESDPIGLNGGINTYAYIGGNPMKGIDPFGLRTEVTIWHPVGWGASSFGHVSTDINGTVYSFGQDGMWIGSASDYYSKNDFRDGLGVVIPLTPDQEKKLMECMKKDHGKYDKFSNNCGGPIQQCLKDAGIDTGNQMFPANVGISLLDNGATPDSSSDHPATSPSKGINAPWAH